MRRSIRQRLTLTFIGLAVGPLLLVGAALAWQSFTTQERQALNLQHEVARRVATQVTAFFEELENQLRVVSQVQGLQGLDRDRQRSVLSELLLYQDVFDALVLLDSEGQEQIHLSRLLLASTSLGNRAEADEFVVPQTSGEVYYSPIRFEETTSEPLMTIAIPLLDARTGLVDAVLVSEVRVKRIWDLIADVRVSEGQSVYIVDTQGKMVAHRNPSVVLRGTSFEVPDREGVQPGLTGTTTVLAVETARFGQQEFNIVAEQVVSEALALAINSLYLIAVVIVATLLVAGGLGFLSVRQIVRPIETLATTAEAISAGDLSQQAAVTRRDEIGALAQAFNRMTAQLRELIAGLEQRVADRTRGLQTAAEVARATILVLDPGELICQTVDLVRERFGLYYAGLFLVDQTGEWTGEPGKWAVLRAGTGEAGQKMLRQDHKLEIGGSSMIGWCVANKQARIALDVGEEAVRFENPLLPETRSELALPLISRGEVIGALTIQSTLEAAFSDEDIAVFQTLAGQVANAIENARLFEQAQAALQEMEAVQRRYLQRVWSEYARTREVGGYEQTGDGLVPLDDTLLPEVRQALQEQRTVVMDGGDGMSVLVVPIVLRGQSLGALGFRVEGGPERWSSDDIALAEVVSEQFALAAENLRLLDETQRRAARERLTREVTDKMRRAANVESIVQTAVDEIFNSLGTSRAFVRLVPPPSTQDDGKDQV